MSEPIFSYNSVYFLGFAFAANMLRQIITR